MLSDILTDIEVLVGVDAAELVEARGPGGATDQKVLVLAVALLRGQQLSVHEVHPDLTDSRVTGDQSEVTGPGHVVMAGVVRVDEVDELVLALVTTAVHSRHYLPTSSPADPLSLVVLPHVLGDRQDRPPLGLSGAERGEEEGEKDDHQWGELETLRGGKKGRDTSHSLPVISEERVSCDIDLSILSPSQHLYRLFYNY